VSRNVPPQLSLQSNWVTPNWLSRARSDGPPWWYSGARDGLAVRLLEPVSRVVAAVGERRWRLATPYHSHLPVVCIGNFTAGGTGKTPLALHVAGLLTAAGERVVVLTRGYGGRIAGPHLVSGGQDTSRDVGDEALLLARQYAVVVALDRAAGARFIDLLAAQLDGPTVVIMDDGLQNPSLFKDLTLTVVDGRRGLGNGHVIPAGPLRQPLAFQLARTDAIVVNTPGQDAGAAVLPDAPLSPAQWLRGQFAGPVLEASPEPSGDVSWLAGRPWVAFAGIGNPGRFYDLLRHLGAELAGTISFPDHHQFSEADAARVLLAARQYGAGVVTTEKDWVRLAVAGASRTELRATTRVLPISLSMGPRDHLRLASLLTAMLKARH
jgi:tetraacyldisaccharide 4'-kinase